MKINLLFLLLVFAFAGCQEKSATPAPSYIHSVIDSLPLDKSKNLLLYTINPNDCISCLNGFKFMNRDMNTMGNGRLYVISVERQIEKQELSKKITNVDLNPEQNKSVLWGKDLFNGINKKGGITLALSSVIIYNFERDSVLYARPIREVSDDREIRTALGKRL